MTFMDMSAIIKAMLPHDVDESVYTDVGDEFLNVRVTVTVTVIYFIFEVKPLITESWLLPK